LAVDVELYGQLLPGVQRRQELHLEQPVTVLEITSVLGLDPEEIGLISIDGVQSELDDLVPPDCRLCFFPPMSGG
jgi:hypothetical protein